MLRASIEYYGRDADVRVITEGAKLGDAGIPHGERLATFAEAAVKGDAAELATARDALRDAAGSAALVDAAAVVGNFERMVRIADGSGIPLDDPVAMVSADLREELGLDAFGGAERNAEIRGLRRLAGRMLAKVLPTALRFMRPR